MYTGAGTESLSLVDNTDKVKLEGVMSEEGNDWVIPTARNDANIVPGMIEGHANMEGVVAGALVTLAEAIA